MTILHTCTSLILTNNTCMHTGKLLLSSHRSWGVYHWTSEKSNHSSSASICSHNSFCHYAIYIPWSHPPSASILQDHNSYDSCMFGPGLVWLHRCTCYSKARVTPFIQTHTHIYMWHTFSAGTCVFSVIAAAHLLTLCTTSCGVDHCWLWFDRWKDLNGQMRVEFQAVNVSIKVGKKRSGVQQICLDYFCL